LLAAIDIAEVRTGEGKLYLHVAIDRISKFVVAKLYGKADVQTGIEHRLTKPNHPWTNGQVERMNRTIKEATCKRYHYQNHASLRDHLAAFLDGYNFAKRLKTLKGMTPFEYICNIWTDDPDRFRLNPTHHMPGLNT
jgi:transposase InsO family protein